MLGLHVFSALLVLTAGPLAAQDNTDLESAFARMHEANTGRSAQDEVKKEVDGALQPLPRPEEPPVQFNGKTYRVMPCGSEATFSPDKRCYYDMDGKFHHWVWNGLTGYAFLQDAQEEYNRWMDKNREPNLRQQGRSLHR
ncbi:MAG: hypothetical protein KGJ84_12115 [Elusimicrobia bacterium]|nr:hypothetical protein [Elusimicrobiota bacterium]